MATDTSLLLLGLRDWNPTHAETLDFFACLKGVIEHNEHPLGNECKLALIELLDLAFDAIDEDKTEQQIEQTWADSKRCTS